MGFERKIRLKHDSKAIGMKNWKGCHLMRQETYSSNTLECVGM